MTDLFFDYSAYILSGLNVPLYGITLNLANQCLFGFQIQQKTMSAPTGFGRNVCNPFLVVGLNELIDTKPGNAK